MSDIYFSRKQAGLGWAVDYLRNSSIIKRNEEIQKIKDDAADKKDKDNKSTTLASNVVGSTTGLLGSGVITTQAISKIKDIKQKITTAKQVARLMGRSNDGEETEEQVSNENFFGGLEEVESKVPEETDEGFQISSNVFDDIEAEQSAAQEAASAPRTASSLFQDSSTIADESTMAGQLFGKTAEQEEMEMNLANFKSSWRNTLVEMNPEEAEQFINEGVRDTKPAFYSSTFEESKQAGEPTTEIEMTNLDEVGGTTETSAANFGEGISSNTGTQIEMSTFSRPTSNIITSGTQFYSQSSEGVTKNIMTDADISDAPLHAYERSNTEMLRTGWGNPRSYETNINDIPKEVDEPQLAPEAVSEMKPVISSSGKLIGVSREGADLSQQVAGEAGEIESGASEAVSTFQSTLSGVSSGIEAVGETAGEAGELVGGLAAAATSLDTAAAAADTVAAVTAPIPIVDIATAAVGAVVTLAGIGVTIGSTVAGVVAANNQKQASSQTEEQLANIPTTQGNLAGKYVLSGNNNIYNLNHNY